MENNENAPKKPQAKIKFKYQGLQLEDTSYVKDHDYKKYNQRKTGKSKTVIPTMKDILY